MMRPIPIPRPHAHPPRESERDLLITARPREPRTGSRARGAGGCGACAACSESVSSPRPAPATPSRRSACAERGSGRPAAAPPLALSARRSPPPPAAPPARGRRPAAPAPDPVPAAQRHGRSAVGQPRVLGQQRAVHVGADHRPSRTPSPPSSPLLPWPRTTRPSGSTPGAQMRAAGVVLEPDQRAHAAAVQIALQRDVADHASSPATVSRSTRPGARHLVALVAAVAMAQQLVAAAHRQHRRRRRRPPRADRRLALEVVRDQHLIAVLAAAEVVEVGVGQRLARAAARSPGSRSRATRSGARAPRCCPGRRRY